MKLVVDTNVLFSFFRDNPVRELIVDSKHFGLALHTPKYALEELRANKSDIVKYAGIKTDEDFEYVMSVLEFFIKTHPPSFSEEFKSKAKETSPHLKDAPFFALAMKLGASIWSNEPRLQKQPSVKVYNTKGLRKLLGLSCPPENPP